MNVRPLEQLTRADFAAQVKTRFRAWVDAQESVELDLAEVTSPKVVATGGTKNVTFENFSLLFLGPVDRLLPQRTYLLESAALGQFELFIVPIARVAQGIQYQAMFNRLVKPD